MKPSLKLRLCAVLLLTLAGACQRVDAVPPVRADAPGMSQEEEDAQSLVQPVPPGTESGQFKAYSTGVPTLHLLVDRETGCEFLATRVANVGSRSVSGYTAIIPRTRIDASGQSAQVCLGGMVRRR